MIVLDKIIRFENKSIFFLRKIGLSEKEISVRIITRINRNNYIFQKNIVGDIIKIIYNNGYLKFSKLYEVINSL